jgi:hypothetical protein
LASFALAIMGLVSVVRRSLKQLRSMPLEGLASLRLEHGHRPTTGNAGANSPGLKRLLPAGRGFSMSRSGLVATATLLSPPCFQWKISRFRSQSTMTLENSARKTACSSTRSITGAWAILRPFQPLRQRDIQPFRTVGSEPLAIREELIDLARTHETL